jgi:hypothetical protein
MIDRYSADSYQPTAASLEGNSRMTVRFVREAP